MTIEDYLSKKGIRIWNRGKNVSKGWISIRCPFCGDHSNHFGIDTRNGLSNCFLCGGKSLVSLIKEIENCDYRKAKEIAKTLDFKVEEEKQERPKTNEIDLLKDFQNELPELHRNYLLNRNFDPELIREKYKILASLNSGSFKFRIIIPIVMNSRVVSFTGRDVTSKSELRYKTCSDEKSVVERKKIIYNFDSVKETITIVEGPTDVWRIGDGSIALLSTSFSKDQVKIICNNRVIKRIFIIFDSEENAQKKAKKLGRMLSATGRFDVVEILDIGENDPGSLSEDNVKYLRKEIGL